MTTQETIEGNNAVLPMVYRGISAQWMSLDAAAEHLGVTAETLRLFVRGVDGRPALASREQRGRLCVRPGEAYDHLRRHAPRCRGLVRPPGYPAPGDQSLQTIAISQPAEIPDDMTDLLRELTIKIHRLASADSPDTLRAISQSVKTLEDIQARRDKMLRKVDSDDVVKMLRALGEIFATHIEQIGAARCSTRLVKWVREVFDVDLLALNIEAARLIEAQLREDAQDTITAVQACVDEKCHGISRLAFEDEN